MGQLAHNVFGIEAGVTQEAHMGSTYSGDTGKRWS